MHRIFSRAFLVAMLAALSPFALAADKPDAIPAPLEAKEETSPEAQQTLRAYLQLQEQLHSAMLAIEQARKDAEAAAQRNNEAIEQARQDSEAAARRNAEVIGARLKLIEQTLTNQRDRELETMLKSNRFMLTMAVIIGAIGFLGMLFTAFCLWRALSRVAQITTNLQPFHAGALGAAEAPFVRLNGPETSSARLLGAIERLEKRIYELEHTAVLPDRDAVEIGNGQHGSTAERVAAALGRGQSLLDGGEPEKAIGCFDEVLKIEPENAEALVKKGTALEHLKRLEEAIDCYDKAIAANQTLTVAYLHKGAVYNQLERFSEALECYEQALRTQQKPVTS